MKVNLYLENIKKIYLGKNPQKSTVIKNNRLGKRSKWAHYKISYMDDET